MSWFRKVQKACRKARKTSPATITDLSSKVGEAPVAFATPSAVASWSSASVQLLW